MLSLTFNQNNLITHIRRYLPQAEPNRNSKPNLGLTDNPNPQPTTKSLFAPVTVTLSINLTATITVTENRTLIYTLMAVQPCSADEPVFEHIPDTTVCSQ